MLELFDFDPEVANFGNRFLDEDDDIYDLPDLSDAMAEAAKVVKRQHSATLIPDLVAMANDYRGRYWVMNKPSPVSISTCSAPFMENLDSSRTGTGDCIAVKFYNPTLSAAEQLICQIERPPVDYGIINWKLRMLDANAKEYLALIKILTEYKFLDRNKHVVLFKKYTQANRCQIVRY